MEKEFDPTPLNNPVRISDAASMLRRKIDPNERPYAKDTMKFNNNLVDEWHDKVLKHICTKDGTIRVGQMYQEWQFFHTGKIIYKFMDGLTTGIICRPSETAITFWVKEFTDKSVKQLVQLGAPLLSVGWKLIIDETLIRKLSEKYEKIYKHTQDPLEWRKLGNDYPKLWNSDHESPFWSAEDLAVITQKVMTILRTPITAEER